MELVIFIGLQAAGKTTFYHNYFAATHNLVSKDCFRNNKNPARRQTQLITAALQLGQSVVVDNTNPTIAERVPIIALGQLYNATIIGYYFKSEVQRCLERNQQRLGKARVPDVAIYSTIKKLTPPAYTEGFHQLFYVQIGDKDNFKISEWH